MLVLVRAVLDDREGPGAGSRVSHSDRRGQHLVDPVAVHVHHLERLISPLEVRASLRDPPQLRQHEASQRLVAIRLLGGEARPSEDLPEPVQW